MKATIEFNNRHYEVDFSKPLDISIPIRGTKDNVNAWYQSHPEIKPVIDDGVEISVAAGASTNFNNIFFNPHAHGTHTECVGHITKEFHSVNENLKEFFFRAEVVTVAPEKMDDDWIISKKQLQYALGKKKRDAIVIRTLPNLSDKLTAQYSHTNPPYLSEKAIVFLRDSGIKHLLIDLPSVDKEKDKGTLLGHKAFWNIDGEIRYDATITEFIFVKNTIKDGAYLLNLQIASFENDATPSKPVLYQIVSK